MKPGKKKRRKERKKRWWLAFCVQSMWWSAASTSISIECLSKLTPSLYQHHGVFHLPVEEMDIPFADLQAKQPDIERFPASTLISFVIPTNHLSYTSFSANGLYSAKTRMATTSRVMALQLGAPRGIWRDIRQNYFERRKTWDGRRSQIARFAHFSSGLHEFLNP